MNLQSNKPLGPPFLTETAVTQSLRQKYESIQVPFSERRALLGIMDICFIFIAVGIAFFIWKWDQGLAANIAQRWYWFPVIILTWQTLAWLNDLYDIPSATHKTLTAVRVVTVAFLALLLYLGFYFVSPWELPRLFFLYFLLAALPLIILWRWTYALIFAASPFRPRVLIVGNNERARIIADLLQEHKLFNHQVLGCVDDAQTAVSETPPTYLPLLGTESDLMTLVKQLRVHEIVVAIERNLERELFLNLVECQANGVQVSWMPDLYEKMSRCVPIQHIDPAWALSAMQNQRHLQARAKRVLDIVLVLSTIPFIFLFVLPFIALAIRLDSPGPVFYRQYRCGLAGKPFQIIKFRTMVTDAEKDGKAQWAIQNDPRITRMGRFLRKSRLDELPQLLNVLRGEMSIVGPRPERPEFVEKLEQEIPYYRTRLLAKPGITGWAQLHHEYGNTVEDAIIKLQYDFYYIRYQSITLDIYTMFRTVGVLLRLKGM
jgi:exopolysaccharide biosynthesis polyprenyl glycosylphosphotransferase